ncbi:MAG: phosphate ABC transporter permease subunit PstC [Ignavibacteriales bacterium]|nr:phosphate ABC transporter permease subunit PstC [Ignavibacteriales bacterium]
MSTKIDTQPQQPAATSNAIDPPIPPRSKNTQSTKLWWKKRFRLGEFLIEKSITAISFLSFAFITLIFIFVFRESLPIFSSTSAKTSVEAKQAPQESYGDESSASELQKQVDQRKASVESLEDKGASASNLTGKNWQPVSSAPKYGMLPLVVGSLKVTTVALLFAAPIAILAALFTAAFAPKWSKEILKPAIEVLAGIPSVVIGFFALIAMATFLQKTFGFQYRLNAFVGGIALSLAVIPIIYTITEDSLSRVPKVMTEASLALGASKWQTALFVVLPAASPGIFAGILLGIGRAFGETMIVLMATGNASMLSGDLFEPVRTMSATIGAEMGEVVFGDTHYTVLFFIGTVLFLFTFCLNAIAELFIRQKLMKRFEGQ